MRHSKEITVSDHVYLVQHPDPETAYKMGIDLTRLVGESFAALAGAAGDEIGDALKDAARLFLAKADSETVMRITYAVLRYVEVQKSDADDQKILLDKNGIKLHFAGRHEDMFEVFVEALVYQQAAFFLKLKTKLQTAGTAIRA